MTSEQKLKVIALISGGKDSLYSILHCSKNGHKVVALGNLHPPASSTPAPEDEEGGRESEDMDMDSFMYQTIGHSIVPLYEEALGIPLYREAITGRAVNAEREYSHRAPSSGPAAPEAVETERDAGEQDETESLFRLLRRIMKHHPSATAVSAGAILSTYQRTRIENVAARLGLVPLAWLWMYPYLPTPSERMDSSSSVTGLLDDMAAVGCEARLIKVASAGLETADVLWGDLAGEDGRVRSALVKTMGRFLDRGIEAAVLGEGGEYESLALDGPDCLWKKRIVVEETRTAMGEGGVTSMRIGGAKCVKKERGRGTGVPATYTRRPRELGEEFFTLLDGTIERWEDICCPLGRKPQPEKQREDIPRPQQGDNETWDMHMSQSKGSDAWYLTNYTAAEAGPDASSQMEGIVRKLRGTLEDPRGLPDEGGAPTSDDIVFSTILLRDMSDFAAVNAVYASLFEKPNPPARVTVACGNILPPGVKVVISVIVDTGQRQRRHGLHVQSRSYWAPANIGPYSQAISVPLQRDTGLDDNKGGLVYIAGQIHLDPATMELRTPLATFGEDWFNTFLSRAVLSLQHLWRVGRAMEVDWWLGGVAFIPDNEWVSFRARIAADMWKMMNTDHSTEADDQHDESSTLDAWDIKYGLQQDPRKHAKIQQPLLPNFSILRTKGASTAPIPPFFAVQVDGLPRGASIEWQGLGGRSADVTITHEDRGDIWITHSEGSGFGLSTYIGIRTIANGDIEGAANKAVDLAVENRVRGYEHINAVIYTPCRIRCAGKWTGQTVPCRSVRGSDGIELVAGIVVHARPLKGGSEV